MRHSPRVALIRLCNAEPIPWVQSIWKSRREGTRAGRLCCGSVQDQDRGAASGIYGREQQYCFCRRRGMPGMVVPKSLLTNSCYLREIQNEERKQPGIALLSVMS